MKTGGRRPGVRFAIGEYFLNQKDIPTWALVRTQRTAAFRNFMASRHAAGLGCPICMEMLASGPRPSISVR